MEPLLTYDLGHLLKCAARDLSPRTGRGPPCLPGTLEDFRSLAAASPERQRLLQDIEKRH